MSASLRYIWREGVSVSADGDGMLVVQGPGMRVSLRQMTGAILDAVRRFDPPGEDHDRLCELIRSDVTANLAHWYYCLERLTRLGFLAQICCAGPALLATLVAVSSGFVSRSNQIIAGRRYVLSRFAFLRRLGEEAVLESPLCHARITFNDCRASALAAALAAPATAAELSKRVSDLPAEAIAGVLGLLLSAGMVEEADDRHEYVDLQTWEFHDLLFHARSRRGRFDAPYGATYRFARRLEPPPALKPNVAGESVELIRPDLDHLERSDPPLARVQSQRRSIRNYDAAQPITARQFGEFLFRVARVTGCSEADIATSSGPVRMQFTQRPYPAGGSLYELEVYAAVASCRGLAAGLYHYDPLEHRLTRLKTRTTEVAGLLHDAAQSAGIPENSMQVLLILTARFARLAWKYQSIAYALTLKHVGVVYQTMYLAATAMGLAPCAVGGGDADLFARAAGTSYCSETSVGEFLLGNPQLEPLSLGS